MAMRFVSLLILAANRKTAGSGIDSNELLDTTSYADNVLNEVFFPMFFFSLSPAT
jgi:hypothetical protein